MNLRTSLTLISLLALAGASIHTGRAASEEERLIEEYYKLSLNRETTRVESLNREIPYAEDAFSGSGSGFETTTARITTTEAPTCRSDPGLCDVTTEYCKTKEDGGYGCVCLPGYNDLNGECAEVKQFGGQFVFGSKTTVYDVRTAEEEQLEEDVKTFLDETYKDTTSYDHSDVVCTSQSTGYLCDYVTVFEAEEFTKDGLSQEAVEEKVKTEIETACSPTCDIGGMPLNKEETIDNIGVIADASKLCGDSCDASSTYCDVISDGDYICVCQNKFVPIDGTKATCEKKLCTSNYDCNDPFGTCNSDADNGVGVCECMTLFNGENCEDPWLFIFVIVMGFIVWIGLVVLLWWCCSGKNNKKKKYKKHTNQSEGIYLDNLSRKSSLENYKYNSPKSLNDIPETGLRAQLPPLVTNQQQNGGYKNHAYSRAHDSSYSGA